MGKSGLFLIGIIFLTWTSHSWARVFDLNKEGLAAYLQMQQAPALQGDLPYSQAGGNGNTYSAAYTYNYFYEFGILKELNERFTLKLGLEIIRPSELKVVRSYKSGVEQYQVNSSISGYAPLVGLEVMLKQWPKSRFYLAGDYGTATVTVQNSYTFYSAGETAHGLTDFREEIKGTATTYSYAAGFEFWFADVTTMALTLGQRELVVDSFSHTLPATTFQGAVVDGQAAKTTDGADRSLNLGGAFLSFSIRIWIK